MSPFYPEHRDRTSGVARWRIALRLVLAIALGLLLVRFILHAGDEMVALKGVIRDLGTLGPVVFILAVVILTMVFFPSSLLAAAGGALFGLGWGTFYMGTGMILAAAVSYLLANRLFGERITRTLARRPRWGAIGRAVKKEGWAFQFLLRLSPLNAMSLNYLLGATGVRYPSYLLASLGLIPGAFAEVYFGHLATHFSKLIAGVSSHSTIHTILIIAGFILVVAVLMAVSRVTRRAIAEAAADPSDLTMI